MKGEPGRWDRVSQPVPVVRIPHLSPTGATYRSLLDIAIRLYQLLAGMANHRLLQCLDHRLPPARSRNQDALDKFVALNPWR